MIMHILYVMGQHLTAYCSTEAGGASPTISDGKARPGAWCLAALAMGVPSGAVASTDNCVLNLLETPDAGKLIEPPGPSPDLGTKGSRAVKFTCLSPLAEREICDGRMSESSPTWAALATAAASLA